MVDVRAGTELAGYRIEAVIGRGGMGVVYVAEHLRLKRKAALKVLAPELASDERFRERFLVEAELAASLDHPNIVTVFDAGEADGLLYIAMRLVEGTDLHTVIERERPLALDRTASIIAQVASALDAAHAKGLIHRDVKPANVLIGGTSHAYLTAFGLTTRPDQTTGLTKTGQFMGSVDYAAPEQFEGKPLDARTDVYSLACVAFECLTGKVPYPRDQEAAVMYAHLRDAPPRPSASRPDLPPAVDGVISRGMAKRPEDRYRRAGGLAAALREALPEGPSEALLRDRRPMMMLAGAAVIVAAVVIAAILVANRHSTPRPAATAGASATNTGTVPGASFVGVARLDPSTGTQARIPISLSSSKLPNSKAITTGGGFVWLVDTIEFARTTLYKISPQTNQVINTLPLRFRVGVAYGDGLVWTPPYSIHPGPGPLLGVDPRTVTISSQIDIPGPPEPGTFVPCCVAIAYGEGSVWVLGPTRWAMPSPYPAIPSRSPRPPTRCGWRTRTAPWTGGFSTGAPGSKRPRSASGRPMWSRAMDRSGLPATGTGRCGGSIRSGSRRTASTWEGIRLGSRSTRAAPGSSWSRPRPRTAERVSARPP